MKVIVRADDVGYTEVCNIGTFKTMEEGIVTAADVMTDTPGTEDALRRLKEMPWISVGWHAHFWGSPVSNPGKLPSLYDPATGHFRKGVDKLQNVNFQEALEECRAQLERMIRIFGKVPDYMDPKPDSPVGDALRRACEEYGIPQNVTFRVRDTEDGGYYVKEAADPRFEGRQIYTMDPGPAYREIRTDSLAAQAANYDPIRYYTENQWHAERFPENAVIEQSWHPGYVDYYVYKLGDQGPDARKFVSIRTEDVHALCSQKLKNWVMNNRIELVNYRDAMYGTCEYQNHLKAAESPLFLKKAISD